MIKNNKSNISGIILTGGNSKRMGQDKAFMKLNDLYFIEIAINLLKECCDEILISSNNKSYDNFGYRVVADEVPGVGPIGGIYSCLKKSKNQHNLVIPVDTPFVKKEVYEQLLGWKSSFKHIVAINNDLLLEPLHAYYRKDTVEILGRLIVKKNLKLQELSKHIMTKFVPIDESLDFYNELLFYNINSKEDMDKIVSGQ